MQKVSLLDLVHNVVEQRSLCEDIPTGPRQIVTLAPWQLWLARKNPDFAGAVLRADGVTIDGRWLQTCLSLGRRNYPLVTGRSVVDWHFNASGHARVAVLGSSDEALGLVTAARPDWLCLGGKYGYSVDQDQLDDILAALSLHGATLVFIALGSPKQETWGRVIADRANVTVVGIGGAIETAVGKRRPPSVALQRLHLEWLQRAAQDPRRFVPRILQALTVLPILIIEVLKENGQGSAG